MTNKKTTKYMCIHNYLDGSYLAPSKTPLIQKALKFSCEAHLGQKREFGAVYIEHPIAVGRKLAEKRAACNLILAALLHDGDCEKPQFFCDLVKESRRL